MTQLNSRGDLAAAEIGFYSISFIVSLAVCIKQGSFSRNAGWLYLVLISILRLIGSSCILYMETQNDYSASLQVTAAITSAVGTAPMLLVLMGLLQRVHAHMSGRAFSRNVFRPIHLLSVAALVLAIVGGVYESNADPDKNSTGKDCMEAAAVIFLVIFLALAVMTHLTALRLAYVPSTETKLVIAGCCVLPFLIVRVIYTVIVSFSNPGSTFYFRDVSVWAQAFMQFLMEVIIISFYVWAGLLTPKEAAVPSYSGSMTTTQGKIGSGANGESVRPHHQGFSSQGV